MSSRPKAFSPLTIESYVQGLIDKADNKSYNNEYIRKMKHYDDRTIIDNLYKKLYSDLNKVKLKNIFPSRVYLNTSSSIPGINSKQPISKLLKLIIK